LAQVCQVSSFAGLVYRLCQRKIVARYPLDSGLFSLASPTNPALLEIMEECYYKANWGKTL
jgi:hypothetical protein